MANKFVYKFHFWLYLLEKQETSSLFFKLKRQKITHNRCYNGTVNENMGDDTFIEII